MKNYLIILFFFLLIACQKKQMDNVILIREFPENKSIKGEYLTFESEPLMIGKITMIDSLFIVQNAGDPHAPLFNVYHKESYKLLASFGRRGNGPNEFYNQMPTGVGQYEIIDHSICMWVRDGFICKLINLSKSILNKKTVIEKKIKTPKSVFIGLDVLILPNDNLFGTSMSQKGRFFYYDSETKETNWIRYFPEVKNPPIKEQQMHNLYVSSTKINKDGNIIVSALIYFKRIDVFNNNAELQFSLVFEDSPTDPAFSISDRPKSFMRYYRDVYISKNKIYALNLERSEGEILEDKYKTSEVHVFTLEGKPVCNYKLDHIMGAFTIDEENGNIFGITMSEDRERTQIIKYKL